MTLVPHAGYFEGILQLRPATDEILAFILKEMEENPRFIVTKEKMGERDNMDIFVSSQKSLLQFSKKLASKFQGVLKTSRRAHTIDHMTQRPLYRVNVLFRPMTIKRGQLIEHRGVEYTITLIDVTKVQLQEKKSGKKTWVKIEDLM